jgi:hypothetical protein
MRRDYGVERFFSLMERKEQRNALLGKKKLTDQGVLPPPSLTRALARPRPAQPHQEPGRVYRGTEWQSTLGNVNRPTYDSGYRAERFPPLPGSPHRCQMCGSSS